MTFSRHSEPPEDRDRDSGSQLSAQTALTADHNQIDTKIPEAGWCRITNKKTQVINYPETLQG